MNLIDTAPGYNFGQSERIVGEALNGMDREKVAVMTKFGIVWTRERLFNKVGDIQLYKNLSREPFWRKWISAWSVLVPVILIFICPTGRRWSLITHPFPKPWNYWAS